MVLNWILSQSGLIPMYYKKLYIKTRLSKFNICCGQQNKRLASCMTTLLLSERGTGNYEGCTTVCYSVNNETLPQTLIYGFLRV